MTGQETPDRLQSAWCDLRSSECGFAATAAGRARELGSRSLARSRHRLAQQHGGINNRYREGCCHPVGRPPVAPPTRGRMSAAQRVELTLPKRAFGQAQPSRHSIFIDHLQRSTGSIAASGCSRVNCSTAFVPDPSIRSDARRPVGFGGPVGPVHASSIMRYGIEFKPILGLPGDFV